MTAKVAWIIAGVVGRCELTTLPTRTSYVEQTRYSYIHNTSVFESSRRESYDTIGKFNVDSKAEYTAYSSTRSQKKN